MDDEMLGDAAAELAGAFIVTFFAAGSLLTDAMVSGPEAGSDLLTIAAMTGAGYALALLVSLPRSGGHVNPVVSIAAWLTARIEATRAGVYVLAQLLGGLLAALVLTSLVPETVLDEAAHGATRLGPDVSLLSAVSWEIVLAFFYTLAVFATVFDARERRLGPAGAGLAAFLAVAIAAPFTGASFNPARSLGPAILAGGWSTGWVYGVGPLLGAALAGGVYDGVLKPSPAAEADSETDEGARDTGSGEV